MRPVSVFCDTIVFMILRLTSARAELKPSCESAVFCHGDLLHTVQTLRIFPDQKTFVDLQLKYPEETVLNKFAALQDKNADTVKQFVSENFLNCTTSENQCEELDRWDPPDWTSNPSIINKITVKQYRQWAVDLNNIWKELGRIMNNKAKQHPEHTSLIYVPNGFIVPGGRFRELYYWDTFWIINGLLICDMETTAKGIIENLLSLVKQRGHVPNGSRVYYWERTQPPMLNLMVDSYYKRTKDEQFIKDNLELLDQEMQYFLTNRQVSVKKDGHEYSMFRYYAPSAGPRPESYYQDYTLASDLNTLEEKQRLYTNLKSSAESGWDFSTRWFIKDKTNNGTLIDVHTENIIPVDLNAILHKCFVLLSTWHKTISKDDDKSHFYGNLANNLQKAIDNVLWNEKNSVWFDYDTLNNKQREYFYMSNFAPLWTKSYVRNKSNLAKGVVKYINKNALFDYFGGTPTSLVYSNEQWDYPNAWAPLQAFLIQGLERTDTALGSTVASHFANVWLQSNYKGFIDERKMFEKYDATSFGKSGTGGEYEGQAGFGWTNGFVFELLEHYFESSTEHS
ncbi:trehalase-like [Cimex lectularius]|uniref:Trehalase n=1 Tax=Cimex lectularius TaxID=79782 RepID=A0A8I6RJL2_CIMLE|nr:trehalase-like [Cimex lectularius]